MPKYLHTYPAGPSIEFDAAQNQPAMTTSFMILTGGRSSRFGSDKSQIVFAGHTLMDRTLESLPAGEVVIVGPSFKHGTRSIAFTQEDPKGGGPVAAIAAGLEKITSDLVVILAIDMPYAGEIVPLLLSRSVDRDALIPADSAGRVQPLCAIYQTSALRRAIIEIGDVSNKSMNLLLGELDSETLIVDPTVTSKLVDIDTQADLEKVLETYNLKREETEEE
ncbi:MAG: molybdenum cofactor guanylyltransferase [Actinobacteria bacterium]|nr:molybdenum cofactor guanylyltransferase [Actinomycetota bacterium]